MTEQGDAALEEAQRIVAFAKEIGANELVVTKYDPEFLRVRYGAVVHIEYGGDGDRGPLKGEYSIPVELLDE